MSSRGRRAGRAAAEGREPNAPLGAEGSRRDLLRRAAAMGGAMAAGAMASRAMAAGAAASGATTQTTAHGASAQPDPPNQAAFSVRRFGAAGDGTTDDTAAVRAAVAAALKARGGRVHFPAGRYRVTQPVEIDSAERLDLTGDGASSTILHEGSGNLFEWKSGASCREVSARHLCLTFAGAAKPPDSAMFALLGGCERSLFLHLLVNSAPGVTPGSGIVSDTVIDTTTVAHCVFWGIGGTGIRAARGSEVRVVGGRIIGVMDPHKEAGARCTGVHLTGDNGGVHIIGTDIIGLHTGLRIGGAGGKSNREVFITHATFDSCVHGLVQHDHTFTSIAGCWSASSDEEQILLEETAEQAMMTIAGGTIFNGGASGRPGAHNGIVVRAGRLLMGAVTVRHNKGTGILMGPAAREYAITGCRIADNGTGVVLDGDAYAFTSNILARNNTPLEDRGGPSKQVSGNVQA